MYHVLHFLILSLIYINLIVIVCSFNDIVIVGYGGSLWDFPHFVWVSHFQFFCLVFGLGVLKSPIFT